MDSILLAVIVGQPPCSGVRQRNFDQEEIRCECAVNLVSSMLALLRTVLLRYRLWFYASHLIFILCLLGDIVFCK